MFDYPELEIHGSDATSGPIVKSMVQQAKPGICTLDPYFALRLFCQGS